MRPFGRLLRSQHGPGALRQLAPVETVDHLTDRCVGEEVRAEVREVLLGGCQGGGAYGYPVVDVRVHLLSLELGDAGDPLVCAGAAASAAQWTSPPRAATASASCPR